jgi:hypothetical protein
MSGGASGKRRLRAGSRHSTKCAATRRIAHGEAYFAQSREYCTCTQNHSVSSTLPFLNIDLTKQPTTWSPSYTERA